VSGVVTFAGLTHWTTEQGRRLVPVTVKTRLELPAAAEVWDSEVSTGGARTVEGEESVKDFADDVPAEFVTVTGIVPGNAAWAAETDAVSCVALTKVVASAAPFQSTAASLVKFVPFTVNVKPCALQ
jgi:hypothetical protein